MLLLGYLAWEGAHREQLDGFIGKDALLGEMQTNGFTPAQTISHIQKLTRKKLIETTERRLLETDKDIEEQGVPEAFRITLLGAYHLKKWIYDFAFIEAMAFDTPIFDNEKRRVLMETVTNQKLSARYQRATIFVEYLDETWQKFVSRPYFNWGRQCWIGNESFTRVEKHLRDLGLLVKQEPPKMNNGLQSRGSAS